MRFAVSPYAVAAFVPLAVATALNAVVRPWLAAGLGGALVQRGAGRGRDRWWTFDEETTRDHPLLTAFLTWSDGEVGMLTVALIVVLLIAVSVSGKLRGAGPHVDHPARED